jgi:cysteine desulfuration protein SufE
MMTINEIQDQIIEEFSELEDWMDKYQLLIDLGSEQEPLAEEYKTDSNLIEGCQSRVWLQADEVDGRLIFQAESDALIVKGVLGIVSLIVDGACVHEVARWEPRIEECDGLRRHLMRRRQGVGAVLERVRNHARRYMEESRS